MKIILIRSLVSSRCLLGEGPVWIAHQNLLYWVDILQNRIFSYSPITRKCNSWSVSEHIGFVLITQENKIIGGLKSGLHELTLNTDGSSKSICIDRINSENNRIRFNDGIMDEEGRIFCCTMDMKAKENLGIYYCYDRNFKRMIIDEGYIVANGPAINTIHNLFYTVETVGNKKIRKGIFTSEFCMERTKIRNRKLLIDWRKLNSSPDGIVIDKMGNLWVGEFNGNVLRRYDPTGLLLSEIPLPVWNVTKITFRYARKTHIYITSAQLGVSQKILKKFPKTGNLLEMIVEL